jgi:hypothetical protein
MKTEETYYQMYLDMFRSEIYKRISDIDNNGSYSPEDEIELNALVRLEEDLYTLVTHGIDN